MRLIPRLLPLCLATAFSAHAQEPIAPHPDPSIPDQSISGQVAPGLPGQTNPEQAWTAAVPVADRWVLCPAGDYIPAFQTDLPTDADPQDATTNIDADHLDTQANDITVLHGNVELQRGGQWLGTDTLTYDRPHESYVAEGNVRYADGGMRFIADRAEGRQAEDSHELHNVRYQLISQRGNGQSSRVQMHNQLGTLYDATYSTCAPTATSWQLRARKIDIDREEGVGVARHATIRIGKVPVLYSPYLAFPVDDRRRTGVLYPTLGQSSDGGFDLSLPYYLNLAPNYDATLTPRLLTERGLMLGGEFRYLTARSQGVIDATWLPDDNITDSDRGFASVVHVTALGPAWYAAANLNYASDDQYFQDFTQSLNAASVTYLPSVAGVYGRGRYWTGSATVSEYQILDPSLPEVFEPYRQLPRLTYQFQRPFGDWFSAGVRSEAVAFEHATRTGGNRVDLKPFARIDMAGAGWFMRPQVAYRYTGYRLDNAAANNLSDDDPSRSLPIYSLDSGLFFERDAQLGGRNLIQTLEPRLFYLRVPFRDQSNLPIFDTQPLTFSYAQLFRDNTFTGADRQADANQATVALTTRLLDADNGRELLSASIGQIRYFDPPRVTLGAPATLDPGGSAYVADIDFNLDDRWTIGASQQYDPELASTTLSSLRGQYRFRGDGVFNAAYRYRRGQLEQADISMLYPLSPQWRLVGRWNYAFGNRSIPVLVGNVVTSQHAETLEALVGVEWESCCVAVRVLGRRYVHNIEGGMNNAIYLEIELKGLGSFGRKTENELQRAILGYTR